MSRLLAFVWLALLALATPSFAQTFPALSGRVVDQANLLDPMKEAELTEKLASLEARTGRQMVVATVDSLEGRTIEDYGYRLGRTWAIGDAEKDDGVLLLVAPNERKVRIETGYGARVFLTDAVSSVIIRENILPRFKDGDMAGGILAGADQVIATMQLPAAEAARRAKEIEAKEAERSKSGGGFEIIFVAFIILFFVILPLLRAAGGRKYRSHRKGRDGIDPWVVLWGLEAISRASRGGGGGSSWGGGGGGWGGGGSSWGGGGGGFSGGGGSFGGGGASGGW